MRSFHGENDFNPPNYLVMNYEKVISSPESAHCRLQCSASQTLNFVRIEEISYILPFRNYISVLTFRISKIIKFERRHKIREEISFRMSYRARSTVRSKNWETILNFFGTYQRHQPPYMIRRILCQLTHRSISQLEQHQRL